MYGGGWVHKQIQVRMSWGRGGLYICKYEYVGGGLFYIYADMSRGVCVSWGIR